MVRGIRHLLAALLLVLSSSAYPQQSAFSVDVIVSPSLASTKLDRSLLRAVFTMRFDLARLDYPLADYRLFSEATTQAGLRAGSDTKIRRRCVSSAGRCSC